MRARSGLARVATVLGLLLAAPSASAQTAPVVAAPTAEFGPAESARLAHVEATLAADRTTSLRWYAVWTGAFAASAGVRGVIWATSDDRDVIAESRVSCVLSLVGLLTSAPVPPASFFGDDDPGPQASATEKRAYLQRREERLTKAADLERLGRAPITHFTGIVLGATAGLYLWQKDGLPGPGAITALSSIAISEIKIWTQPTRALRTAPAPAKPSWMVALGVAPVVGPRTGTGVVLVGAF